MTSILRGLTDRYDDKGLRLPPLCIFYAYCLMSNHVHLLIQEREEHISDVVKRIGVTYPTVLYMFQKLPPISF